MSELTEDAKIIAASNLTLAFFVREHARYTSDRGSDLQDDSREVVQGFFEEFKQSLDK